MRYESAIWSKSSDWTLKYRFVQLEFLRLIRVVQQSAGNLAQLSSCKL